MYNSLHNGIAAFQAIEQTVRNARKNLGNHIASADLVPADGSSTPPSTNNGHFTFHPNTNVILENVFKIVQEIP
ncbi:hypothetical protein [Lysobacter capsici]|uniref:hypothetical protein n=1 Tax=Lysobacter capsici TaxID=435897 RepID=UPI00128C7CB2|nr:hypothetical protein [Lysobacter capsici]